MKPPGLSFIGRLGPAEDTRGVELPPESSAGRAMVAMEPVEDRAPRATARPLTHTLLRRCAERGVLLIGAGTCGNIVRRGRV